MSDKSALMGIFQDVDAVTAALDELRQTGIPDGDITILSSLPYSAEILGRPHVQTKLPLISLGSVALGLLVGAFYNLLSPHLYTIRVGGQPVVPGPPTAVLMYEFAMVFLILGTFIGMLVLNKFPSYQPDFYHPKLTDGRIGVLLHCSAKQKEAVWAILESRGAEDVQEVERRSL